MKICLVIGFKEHSQANSFVCKIERLFKLTFTIWLSIALGTENSFLVIRNWMKDLIYEKDIFTLI